MMRLALYVANWRFLLLACVVLVLPASLGCPLVSEDVDTRKCFADSDCFAEEYCFPATRTTGTPGECRPRLDRSWSDSGSRDTAKPEMGSIPDQRGGDLPADEAAAAGQ
jgi:hypothetical protein